jgi:hypothetical protein
VEVADPERNNQISRARETRAAALETGLIPGSGGPGAERCARRSHGTRLLGQIQLQETLDVLQNGGPLAVRSAVTMLRRNVRLAEGAPFQVDSEAPPSLNQ